MELISEQLKNALSPDDLAVYEQMGNLCSNGFVDWLQEKYGAGITYVFDDYCQIMGERYPKIDFQKPENPCLF